jgi:hypothetical protein
MLVREMKIDVKPLCDKHLVEMGAVRMKAKMGGSDIWTWAAFRCPAPGCTRSFDSGGYTTTVGGSIDPESTNFIGCEDGGCSLRASRKIA